MVDSRTKAKEIIASLRATTARSGYSGRNPLFRRAAETSGRGKGIFAHDKNSKGRRRMPLADEGGVGV